MAAHNQEPNEATADPTAMAEPENGSSADEAVDRETLRRALRELEAAKARVERDAKRVYDETRADLVADVLPVLDNLDRTIQSVESKCPPALVQGVRMVEGQLERVLARFGLERIDSEGHEFDPQRHEAIATVPVTDARFDGLIIQQLEPGYRFGDRLLRAAKVVVGKLEH